MGSRHVRGCKQRSPLAGGILRSSWKYLSPEAGAHWRRGSWEQLEGKCSSSLRNYAPPPLPSPLPSFLPALNSARSPCLARERSDLVSVVKATTSERSAASQWKARTRIVEGRARFRALDRCWRLAVKHAAEYESSACSTVRPVSRSRFESLSEQKFRKIFSILIPWSACRSSRVVL